MDEEEFGEEAIETLNALGEHVEAVLADLTADMDDEQAAFMLVVLMQRAAEALRDRLDNRHQVAAMLRRIAKEL